MRQRVGEVRVTEAVAERDQPGRQHPLIGLGQFAGTLAAQQ
jgi:hypothetical protein